MKKYDLIVIGAGGGTKLAAPVARLDLVEMPIPVDVQSSLGRDLQK